jgi:selenocysteine-specific elongation factor
VRATLQLPDDRLVAALVEPPLAVRAGSILSADAPDGLAPKVRDSLTELERQVTAQPGVVAHTEPELAACGLRPADIAAATNAGRLVRLPAGVFILPAMIDHAVDLLSSLDQPFTASSARTALGTTRRVIIPLLEHLAELGRTCREADGRHRLSSRICSESRADGSTTKPDVPS